jgi:Mce-associated membrane protein
MTSIATKPTVQPQTAQGGPLRVVILAVAALVVIAFVAAGWFGLSWYTAAHDKSLAVGLDRDAALRDAQQAALTLNTLDYRHVQDGLTLWEQSATGPLLTQLRANHDSYARAITDSATVSNGNVIDAAVASLDERAGTAQVLVGLDVTSQVDKGDPGCVHRRVHLDMARTGHGWKVSNLTPVGETYSEPGPCPPAASPK